MLLVDSAKLLIKEEERFFEQEIEKLQNGADSIINDCREFVTQIKTMKEQIKKQIKTLKKEGAEIDQLDEMWSDYSILDQIEFVYQLNLNEIDLLKMYNL
ncbi:unnamed protein product [Brachionus calyciflorus]|uniref:Uncharacterized protein n=1 Tax=Brachionus calyciflorus TaxID=104777 RepID=A0A814FL87_9BILA|nr:unnamed protein product [Brachionus calyciflorus]